ncbi:MAG: hypothetical protein J5755_03705, partial [Clostridia bacterium]|nr:hypothetical protein [Clostridia bacterium]
MERKQKYLTCIVLLLVLLVTAAALIVVAPNVSKTESAYADGASFADSSNVYWVDSSGTKRALSDGFGSSYSDWTLSGGVLRLGAGNAYNGAILVEGTKERPLALTIKFERNFNNNKEEIYAKYCDLTLTSDKPVTVTVCSVCSVADNLTISGKVTLNITGAKDRYEEGIYGPYAYLATGKNLSILDDASIYAVDPTPRYNYGYWGVSYFCAVQDDLILDTTGSFKLGYKDVDKDEWILGGGTSAIIKRCSVIEIYCHSNGSNTPFYYPGDLFIDQKKTVTTLSGSVQKCVITIPTEEEAIEIQRHKPAVVTDIWLEGAGSFRLDERFSSKPGWSMEDGVLTLGPDFTYSGNLYISGEDHYIDWTINFGRDYGSGNTPVRWGNSLYNYNGNLTLTSDVECTVIMSYVQALNVLTVSGKVNLVMLGFGTEDAWASDIEHFISADKIVVKDEASITMIDPGFTTTEYYNGPKITVIPKGLIGCRELEIDTAGIFKVGVVTGSERALPLYIQEGGSVTIAQANAFELYANGSNASAYINDPDLLAGYSPAVSSNTLSISPVVITQPVTLDVTVTAPVPEASPVLSGKGTHDDVQLSQVKWKLGETYLSNADKFDYETTYTCLAYVRPSGCKLDSSLLTVNINGKKATYLDTSGADYV